ncbi:MAG TPA: replication protein [Elusimicrobia bacterium]|nr:replication protein [Elusimicrobiota bacterium]
MRGLLLSLLLAPCAQADAFKDFQALSAARTEGEDYRIVLEDRRSTVTVFAVHGGTIEPGTSEVARALAGSDWNLYLFEGLKKDGAKALHVTSAHFDEPSAVALSSRSVLAVSLHRQKDSGTWACVGGSNAALRRRAAEALRAEGFKAQEPCRRLPGASGRNIVNRAREGGLQLELTRRLLRALTGDEKKLERFCRALRSALLP